MRTTNGDKGSIQKPAHDDNMLTAHDGGGPGLGDDDPVYTRHSRPREHVDVIEIVQVAHDVARPNFAAAVDDWLVVPGERRHGEAGAVDHFRFALRAGAVVSDRLDLAAQLTVMNGGGQHALPRIAHAFRVHRLAPAKLRADGDFSQPLGFAGQETGGLILINHQ